ncbi:MAG: hypothetical protein R2795_08910 [Saprospiraceae bacterium]
MDCTANYRIPVPVIAANPTVAQLEAPTTYYIASATDPFFGIF